LDGKRVRKNFPTRAEAQDEAQALEIKGLQGKTGIRATATRLTEDQLHEAESLFQRVAGLSHPLAFYVDFALANYREPTRQKALAAAVTEYVAASHFSIQRRDQKLALQRKIKILRQELAELLAESLMAPKKAQHVAEWDPFDPQSSADFFDPHWMFGRSLADGFDVVLGNPPYVTFKGKERVDVSDASRRVRIEGSWSLGKTPLLRSPTMSVS
jgi:hypothetical protein